jgi:hypothetical protein
MLSRFQGGLFDGVVLDIPSRHTRDGHAPDRLEITFTGDGPHTEHVTYYSMELNRDPEPADGVLAIYRP